MEGLCQGFSTWLGLGPLQTGVPSGFKSTAKGVFLPIRVSTMLPTHFIYSPGIWCHSEEGRQVRTPSQTY